MRCSTEIAARCPENFDFRSISDEPAAGGATYRVGEGRVFCALRMRHWAHGVLESAPRTVAGHLD